MKKILIFSVEEDLSTDEIICWLKHYNIEPVRLNRNDYITGLDIDAETNGIEISYRGGSSFRLEDFAGFWYRRPGGTYYNIFGGDITNSDYNSYFQDEFMKIRDYVEQYIEDKPHLNNISDYENDKLLYLRNAVKCGLTVPEWIVSGSLDKLSSFRELHGNIITKTLNMPFFSLRKGSRLFEIGYGTNMVTEQNIDDFRSKGILNFLPTFFQRYIEKYVELRIFYLDGSFYAMAIFSQHSEKTRVDYRNYDRESPNRCVPFNLPDDIKQRLTAFMNLTGLNCGSIDMILGTDYKYYFLEVNPVGQFQWLSHNCNYFIEQKIASYFYEH